MLNKLPQGLPIDLSSSIGRALVGCWRFTEGGGGVAYDIARRNNGVLTNEPLWTVGDRGRALSLDGVDDYVEVQNTPSISITVGALHVRFLPQSSGSFQNVISKGNLSTDRDGYLVYLFSGEICVELNSASNSSGTLHSGFTVTLGQWCDLVVQWNGFRVQIAVNGALYYNQPQTVVPNSGVYPLRLGINQSYNTPFQGFYDSVNIFNRDLLPSEILRLYQDPDCYLVTERRLKSFAYMNSNVIGDAAFLPIM